MYKSGRRVTFAEKKNQGVDFLTYMRSENIDFIGLTKKDLQTIYIDRYVEEKSRNVPKKKILAYGPVIQALFTCGQLHLRGIHIHKGPAAPPYLNSHRKGSRLNGKIVTANILCVNLDMCKLYKAKVIP